MSITIAVAAAAIAIAVTALLLFSRSVKRARRARAEISAALGAGKCMLYFSATSLKLNGEAVPDSRRMTAGRQCGIVVEPGHYESVGTYVIRDDEGKLIATFTEAELGFTLKAGREYGLGVFLFDTEILSQAVSHRQLGPSGSGQGILALACVAC
ncbi:MAG: hypothetical protein LBG06_12000 [Deltaproteobacteria bacterium]|nr:hypothetical protein [Deltaproteobacteria bacterium]